MSPNQWGPPTWLLFHCMAEKINAEKFSEMKPMLILFIKRICANLPCPDCSLHATAFMSKVNFTYIKTKTDFIHLMYVFHNIVNRRKKKPLFNVGNLSIYSTVNLIDAFNGFISVFQTRNNMKLLADNFQRRIIIKEFKSWIFNNLNNFDK